MKMSDSHIHTVYSGHSEPDMTVANIIRKAEQMDLKEIAITEHSFDWHLGPKGNFALICDEVAACEPELTVMTGMEIDPDSTTIGNLIFEDFDKTTLSPLLIGTHSFPGIARGWHETFYMTAFDKKYVYCIWFRMMEKIIERGIVDILAHPGRLIMQNGIIDAFDTAVLKDFEILFAVMKENNTAFEINESLLNRFPSEALEKSYSDLVQLAVAMELNITIGSDAHSLEAIGHFPKTVQLMQNCKLNVDATG